MSAETKRAAENYLLRRLSQSLSVRTALNRWYFRNASAKHGVPYDELEEGPDLAASLSQQPQQQPQQHEHRVAVDIGGEGVRDALAGIAARASQPAPQRLDTAVVGTEPQAEQSSLVKRALPYVLAAAAGAGVPAAYAWWNSDAPPPAPQVEITESPLQWLEDHGEHWPQGANQP